MGPGNIICFCPELSLGLYNNLISIYDQILSRIVKNIL